MSSLRLLLWSVALAVSAIAASARDVIVRSGEHAGFTRVVVLFPQGTEWTVRQSGTEILLTARGEPLDFDLSNAFRRIPRARIADMTALPDRATLRLTTAMTTRVSSFGLSQGGAVLDISDATDPAPEPQNRDLPSSWWREDSAGNQPPRPTLPLPDSRVQQAEQDLLLQLGRSATQGVVRINPMAPARAAPEPATPRSDILFGMDSLTVMDRDMGMLVRQMGPGGRTCAADEDYDPGSWLNDQPPVQQISAARRSLIGEFDRPDQNAVTGLARVYLALGMSTEARRTLEAFPDATTPVRKSDAAILAMADVIDDRPASASLTAMRGCPGRVAIWAFLASPEPAAATASDMDAVQRSFSALPQGLRDALGMRLIDRLLKAGARETAEAIRNTFRRSETPESAAARLAEARLELADKAPAAAADLLGPVAQGKDAEAARAVAMRIDSFIDRHRAVPEAETQRAADFVHLLGDGRDSYRMRRAQILGAASVGDFDTAFAVLDAWPAGTEDDLRHSAGQKAFDILSRVPDDNLFLSRLLPRVAQARETGLGLNQQIALSERLSTLGFGEAGASVLDPPAQRTPRGRVALARAALANGDPPTAIAALDGMDGSDVAVLRAEALAGLGEHAAAAEMFAAMNDPARAAQEAWRSGSPDAILRFGTEAQKTAIRRSLSRAPAPEEGTGLLSRANRQISDSQADRAAWETLLSQVPPP